MGLYNSTMAISTGFTVGLNVNNCFFNIRHDILMSNKFQDRHCRPNAGDPGQFPVVISGGKRGANMAIRKVGKNFQIDYYDPNGKQIRQNFKKKKDAVAEEAKRKALMAEGRYLDVKKGYNSTLGEAIELYEKNFSQQPSFNTAKIFFIERYKEYFGIDKRLTDIRYRDLETYRSHLKQQLVRGGTFRADAGINREISCLRHMLKKAVEWELIGESPFSKGGSLFIKENNQRLRYLTEAEIDLLLDACATKVIQFPDSKKHVKQMTRKDEYYLYDIVECALNSGMRKGEMLSLKWKQVRNGFIYLGEPGSRKTKTSNPRQIPINDDLDALFKRVRQRQGLKSLHVFTYQGEPIKSLKNGFKAALKRAGIDDFRFHDLRHTFASHFVMRGGDLKALQEILGHTTLTMTMKYAHLAPGHKQEAINRLNGLTTKKSDGHKMVTFPKNEKSTTS
jgi:integrase